MRVIVEASGAGLDVHVGSGRLVRTTVNKTDNTFFRSVDAFDIGKCGETDFRQVSEKLSSAHDVERESKVGFNRSVVACDGGKVYELGRVIW